MAKGGDPKRMMAEIFGKESGYCRGKGGSQHIADFSIGMLGACGIVGGGIPIATGAGLSIRLRKSDQVSVCFFGDGAANEGSFHESLNLASTDGPAGHFRLRAQSVRRIYAGARHDEH